MRQMHSLLLCYVNTDLHPLSYVLMFSERAHVSERFVLTALLMRPRITIMRCGHFICH